MIKVVVLVPGAERPTLHEKVVRATLEDVQEFAEREIGVQRLIPVSDLDYNVSSEIQMVYSNGHQLGHLGLNMVATRLLMDKFLLETPIVSDNIDLFLYAPRGPVVFFNKTLKDITTKELLANWHLFFSNKNAYRQLLHTRPNMRTIKQFLDLYREIYHTPRTMMGVMHQCLREREPSAGAKQRTYQTVLYAAIYKALEPFGIGNMGYRSIFA